MTTQWIKRIFLAGRENSSSKPVRVSIVGTLPESMVKIEISIIYLVSEVLTGIRVIYFRSSSK